MGPARRAFWRQRGAGFDRVIVVPEPVDHPDFPGLPAYPAEGASFYDAFPEYMDFVQSGGTLFIRIGRRVVGRQL